jgi:N-acetylglucosamine-6-phosphate deacetylase
MNEQRTALVNGRVVLPDRVVDGQAVVIEGGRIAGLSAVEDLGSGTEIIDAGGRLILPGLIDIHIHGAQGHTFNEPSEAAFGAVMRANASMGVTSVVGTLATASISDLTSCLQFGRGWMGSTREGSRLLGMHLESPYINLAQKGALDPANIRTPDDGSVDPLLEFADVLRIFVLAPELPGALELTERLVGLGIVVSAGHSSAQEQHVRAAMARGLSHVTHIWSAMSSTVREGPWRKPGLLEAALVFDGLIVEMIADNRHLPPTLMKLARKCIEPDRLCVISDATSGALLPEGTTFNMGAMSYEVRDGVGMMFDRTSFGGSTTLLGKMVSILRNEVGVPLPEAVRMCSLTPARAVGWEDRIGSIEAGKYADLALWDDTTEAGAPWRVMIGGEWFASSH